MSDRFSMLKIKTVIAPFVMWAAIVTFLASILYVIWLIVSNYPIPSALVALWLAGMFAADHLYDISKAKKREAEEKEQEDELIEF